MKASKMVKLPVKILLLIVLFIGIIALLGCVGGMQPVGWSGVAIADGTLFVGSKEGRLVAIPPDDRPPLWSEPLKAPPSGGFGCAPTAGGGGGLGCLGGGTPAVAIYGTPAVSSGLAYIAGYNGKVYAYNATTMQPRWVYPREGFLKPIVGGITAALNRIYFGGSDGKVYALDAATGDKIWEFQTGDKIWSTPAVDGSTVYIPSRDKKLYALDIDTGQKKWEFETEGAIAATPLVQDNTVYVGSFDRNLYAVDATTGKEKWRFQAGKWFWAKPVILGNIIYAPSLDWKLYALDVQTGNKLAEFNLGSPIASSPVLVDNLIIVATQKGDIYSLDTSTNKLTQLTTVKVPSSGGCAPPAFSAPLSASNDIVYIHTADLTVHRVKAKTGEVLNTISLKRPG